MERDYDIDTVEDDPETYYALRITPYPNTVQKVVMVRENIVRFLNELEFLDGDCVKEYLFGQEYEDNYHFHVVFITDNEHNIKKGEWIKKFKNFLYDIFDVPGDKKGNPTYALEFSRDRVKTLCYAVKDGDYESSPGWYKLANQAYELSNPKKSSMRKALADISDRFMTGHLSEQNAWIELGMSRADLGLPLSIKWIDEMIMSLKAKKDPEFLRDYWQDRETRRAMKDM